MINTVEKNYNLLNTSLFNFKVTNQDGTILWVPNDEANTDYQAIQEWIADGGTVIDNGAE
jgi:hypothetical protein